MFSLTPTSVIIKRLSVFLLVVILVIPGLILYNTNREEITHYRPYYLEAYYYVARHRLDLLTNSSNIPSSSKKAKSIPVLVYHGMVTKQDAVSTTIGQFATEMFALKKAGYQTVHIQDFYDFVQGKKDLPDKSFLLTFDDGRKDSFYPVDPILQELNYSAVMFMITSTLESSTNNFHLIKREADRLVKSGRWDLQAHTHRGHGLIPVDSKGTKGHFYSNKVWLKNYNRLETDQEFKLRVSTDLLDAKANMKKYFGIDAFALAFPFNDYARDTLNFPGAKKIFDEAIRPVYKQLYFQTEPNKGFSTNIYGGKAQLIRRINVNTSWTAKDLLSVLDKSRQKDLPINYESFSADQGWVRNTGSQHYEFGTMILQSNEESRGSFSYLDGTESLGDFTEKVNLGWSKGTDLTLTFRQTQISDFYYLTIYRGGLKVGHFLDGHHAILDQRPTTLLNIHGRHDIIFSVKGNRLSLTINGQRLLENAPYDIKASHGGIGFEIWDSKPDNAYVKLRSLQVNKAQ